MTDRFAFLMICALLASACYVVASMSHITAYTEVITWASKLAS